MSCLEERCEWFSKLPRSCSYFRKFPRYSIPVLPLVTPLSPLFCSSLKTFQSSLVPVLRVLWCRQSLSFIKSLMSSEINGFRLCRIFTVLTGALFSKQAKNKSLNASSLSSTESLRLAVSQGIWAMSVANWSAL